MLPVQGYRKARERKNREGKAYRSSSGGNGVAASLQSKIQSPPVMSGRGAATAAMKVKMSYVGEQRRRRAGGRWRRCSFSVPRSSGEAQETEERRKKKMVKGKKSK
jgi:hypothetical protein